MLTNYENVSGDRPLGEIVRNGVVRFLTDPNLSRKNRLLVRFPLALATVGLGAYGLVMVVNSGEQNRMPTGCTDAEIESGGYQAAIQNAGAAAKPTPLDFGGYALEGGNNLLKLKPIAQPGDWVSVAVDSDGNYMAALLDDCATAMPGVTHLDPRPPQS